jgi:putative glutamine amidotransferase
LPNKAPTQEFSNTPVIGIPIPRDYFEREPLWGNAGGYRAVNEIVQAVQQAGGEARLLFPGDTSTDIQALILPGGGDLDPSFYGQAPVPHVLDTDKQLDEFQLGLAQRALESGLPLLAICRGMQVLNVAAGGTLVQHLESTQDHFPVEARDNPDLRGLPVHKIALERESRLAILIGDTQLDVNSLHHQAADLVPPTLQVVAVSEDGVVEALEGPGSFQLGVQFHPEDLRHTDPRFQGLFDELVSQAAA